MEVHMKLIADYAVMNGWPKGEGPVTEVIHTVDTIDFSNNLLVIDYHYCNNKSLLGRMVLQYCALTKTCEGTFSELQDDNLPHKGTAKFIFINDGSQFSLNGHWFEDEDSAPWCIAGHVEHDEWVEE
jgi:hypothetical protein